MEIRREISLGESEASKLDLSKSSQTVSERKGTRTCINPFIY